MDANGETRIRRMLDLWADFPVDEHRPPLVLNGRYVSAEAFETRQAVHIHSVWEWSEPRPQMVTLDGAGGLHVDVVLENPLANRVLLTGTGQPLTVLRQAAT